jgi:tmRNA-binding protein
MAMYEITLEFETGLSVDGTRVKSETSRETQIVTGVFADVAKLTKDVYSVFE